MKTDHIGIATRNLDKTREEYELLGYVNDGNCIFDEYRNIIIQFMKKNDTSRIELIQVKDNSKKSPIDNVIQKGQISCMYHFCYKVDDLKVTIESLNKQKYVLISEPHEAVAFQNKKVCFLYNRNIGIVELVEG